MAQLQAPGRACGAAPPQRPPAAAHTLRHRSCGAAQLHGSLAARSSWQQNGCSSSSGATGRRRRPALAAAAAAESEVGTAAPGLALPIVPPLEQDAAGQLNRAQLDAAIQRAVRRLAGASSSVDLDQAELEASIRRAIDEEVHVAFEAEMSGARQNIKEAVDEALHEMPMKVNVTANVNSLMAIMGVILYWRGLGGLLDILLEDSLEGYVACVALGFGIISLIRWLKLPVVEGGESRGF